MRAQNLPRELVMARIQGYAREIVPAFNAYFYFRVGYWLGRKIARSLYRVRVGYADNEGLDENATRPGRIKAAWNTLAFTAHQAGLALRSEWHRFGYACVNFGTPVSMREYLPSRGFDFRKLGKEQRYARVAEFGAYLMDRIGKLIPVLPVPLVALVFERNPGKALSELEIKSEVELLIERLEAAGAHVYVPRRDRDYAITAGLRMMLLRHMVEQHDGLYAVAPAEATLLRYYANSIAHLLTQK